MLTKLPKEIAAKVCGYLEAKDLLTVTKTCTLMYEITTDNLIWASLARKNYPHAEDQIRKLIKMTLGKDKSPFESVYSIYRNILRKFGDLFGLHHSDYSFFHGGFLNVRITDADDYFLIGELIIPVYFYSFNGSLTGLNRIR